MFAESRQHSFGINGYFSQAFYERAVADKRVRKCGAEYADDGRIREVALQARNREFLREVRKERVGNAEVAFRLLEIYRIDLVRHRRGAAPPFLRFWRKATAAW